MEEIEELISSKRMFEQMSENADTGFVLESSGKTDGDEDGEFLDSIISNASSDVFRKAMLKSCRSGMIAVARHISSRQLESGTEH